MDEPLEATEPLNNADILPPHCKFECTRKPHCEALYVPLWPCTRKPGHAGPHVACMGERHDVLTWRVG